MKILIPSAKQLSLNQPVKSQPLSVNSKIILQKLQTLPLTELAKVLHITEQQAQIEQQRFQAIMENEAHYYPALELFDGLMFRQIKLHHNVAYYKQHVWIATALYGLIPAYQKIAPHRLDFMTAIKIDKQSLKQFWRTQYNQIIQEDEITLSLLSSEFETVFSPKIRQKLVTVQFLENQKVHSTISKKGRGQLVQAMAQNNCQSLESVKKLRFNGFQFDDALSQEHQLVFTKND